MEKKEKTWQRRGLFALVSNRRKDAPFSGDDALFPTVDDDLPAPEDEE